MITPCLQLLRGHSPGVASRMGRVGDRYIQAVRGYPPKSRHSAWFCCATSSLDSAMACL